MFAHLQRRTAAAGLDVKPLPVVALALLFLAVTTPSVLLFIKAPLLLPSLGLISLVVANLVAMVAWAMNTNRAPRHITLWDGSGTYAFVGFATGMLSELMKVIELISFPADSIGEAR